MGLEWFATCFNAKRMVVAIIRVGRFWANMAISCFVVVVFIRFIFRSGLFLEIKTIFVVLVVSVNGCGKLFAHYCVQVA